MEVLAVEFNRHGRLVHVRPGEVAGLRAGERVVVPTDECPEVATVAVGPRPLDETLATHPLDYPAVLRRATAADEARDRTNRLARAEAELVATELIERHDLPMKVIGVDLIDCDPEVDRLLAIYFTAPGRVDFRALVSDLARALHARIDLRQIASREAAAAIGGVGHCGLTLCCATFQPVFEPVTQRMARVQSLSPNPLQLQGACGRLLCCLAYENERYVEFARTAPSLGTRVLTPAGPGTVVGSSVPLDAVIVRHDQGLRQPHPLGDVVPLRSKAPVDNEAPAAGPAT